MLTRTWLQASNKRSQGLGSNWARQQPFRFPRCPKAALKPQDNVELAIQTVYEQFGRKLGNREEALIRRLKDNNCVWAMHLANLSESVAKQLEVPMLLPGQVKEILPANKQASASNMSEAVTKTTSAKRQVSSVADAAASETPFMHSSQRAALAPNRLRTRGMQAGLASRGALRVRRGGVQGAGTSSGLSLRTADPQAADAAQEDFEWDSDSFQAAVPTTTSPSSAPGSGAAGSQEARSLQGKLASSSANTPVRRESTSGHDTAGLTSGSNNLSNKSTSGSAAGTSGSAANTSGASGSRVAAVGAAGGGVGGSSEELNPDIMKRRCPILSRAGYSSVQREASRVTSTHSVNLHRARGGVKAPSAATGSSGDGGTGSSSSGSSGDGSGSSSINGGDDVGVTQGSSTTAVGATGSSKRSSKRGSKHGKKGSIEVVAEGDTIDTIKGDGSSSSSSGEGDNSSSSSAADLASAVADQGDIKGAGSSGSGANKEELLEYRLRKGELPEALEREMKAFFTFCTERFWGQQQDPIAPVTAAKYLDHMRGLLGWMHHVRGVPQGALSFTAALPSEGREGVAVAYDYMQWLSDVRGCNPRTCALAARSIMAAAKFLYHSKSKIKSGAGAIPYSDLDVIKELRAISAGMKKEEKVAPRVADESLKWLDWPAYLALVRELRRECAGLDQRGHPRSPSAVAWSLQRYLVFAILSCVPDRQRTLRELEIGRTLVKDAQGRWVIRHGPKDYKTGKAYGERPPLIISPAIYPELDAYIGKWRAELGPTHAFLFTQKGGKPHTDVSLHKLFSTTAYRLSGQKTNPHLVRDMIVTYLRSGAASERELEALAIYMGHSVAMQRASYDRRTAAQKVEPAVELLASLNDRASAGSGAMSAGSAVAVRPR